MLQFPTIVSDLSVVRSLRLLWKIDMIMIKVAKTNFMSWEAVEKILDDLEVTVVTKENSPSEFTGMGRPYPTASKREFSQVTRVTLRSSKKISVASHDMKFVFARVLMIIPVSQSKRDGRTTRRSDSMVANASKERVELQKVQLGGVLFFSF